MVISFVYSYLRYYILLLHAKKYYAFCRSFLHNFIYILRAMRALNLYFTIYSLIFTGNASGHKSRFVAFYPLKNDLKILFFSLKIVL
jgi:hypothetical protein